MASASVLSGSPYIKAGAVISACGTYRYHLWREWRGHYVRENWIPLGAKDGAGHELEEPKPVVFVMLNPSTADGSKDDATIRKCVKFAMRWGYNRLEVVNLFAYRATDPQALLKLTHDRDPVGDQNQRYFDRALNESGDPLVICAWGQHGAHLGQDQTALGWMIPYLKKWCFGLTKVGQPLHPLYQRDDADLVEFRP
jgi:hypothetical protein